MASPEYLIPPVRISPDLEITRDSLSDRLRWLKESLNRGKVWYRSQRTTVDPDEAMNTLAGLADPATVDTKSDLRSADIDRNVTDLIAELSNLRAEGDVKSEDKKLYDQAVIIHQRYKAWFTMERVKRTIKDAISWAVVMGTGFLVLDYDINKRGPGKGEHRVRAFGPHQVLPDGLPTNGDYQGAYAVHIIEETPLQTAKIDNSTVAEQIQPDRGMPTNFFKRLQASRWMAPVFNLFGVRGEKPDDAQGGDFPTVDIITSHVKDRSLNRTGETVTMGDPGTTWSYQVPSLGTQIDTGVRTKEGQILWRDVTEVDAMLYPRGRMIKWCSSCLIDDGPNRAWHGKVNVVPLALKKWPWDPNGTSLLKNVANVQRAMTRIMRGVDDAFNVRLDPPIIWDESLANDGFTEKYDPRQPGVRIRSTALQVSSDLVKPILPLAHYDVPEAIPKYLEWLQGLQKWYLFVQDVQAIAKARQIPSSDTIEKMIELAGPVIRDMLDGIETSVSDMGQMFIMNVFQWDRAGRRLEILGNDGVSKEDIDWDPGNLVPSHMPQEDREAGVSQFSLLERGIARASQMSFYITPGSLHDLNRTTQKLMLIQAIKGAGLQVDDWTKAEIFSIANYGAPPEGTHTVMERLVAAKRMAEEAMARMGEIQGGADGRGRPHSNQKPPTIKNKDGGTRSSLVTS